MATTFKYTGVEVLEAVSYAKNYNKGLLDIVKHELPKKKNAVIVDFGAGSAMYAHMLNDEIGIKPVCVELDLKLRNSAKKDGFKVAKSMKELSGKVDFVYSLNVFEHIKNDGEIAKDIYNHLSNNGTLVVYVPAFQMLYSSMDKLVEHYRRYRMKRLRKILVDAGFEIKHIQYADPLGFFAALVFKWFGNKDGVVSPTGVKIFDRFLYPISRMLQPLTARLFGKNVYAVAVKRKR